jgi:RNA polymerase II-associated protein 3
VQQSTVPVSDLILSNLKHLASMLTQCPAQAPVTKKAAPTAKKVSSAKTKGGSAATATPTKSREELEKEDGNGHYKRGDYVAAIKSYTRALGFNARNVVVLSNRAMAYLKNKEYGKAEDDCSLAIKMDAAHVKSYSRRGTARNALGKHRLALLDFERALELDPSSKQTASQVAATKELLRTAIKRAPKRTQFSIQVLDNPTDSTPVAVVSLPEEAPEDKENVPLSSSNKITVVEESMPSKPMEKASEEPSTLRSSPPPAPPIEVARAVNNAPLPKLPKKSAASSYEFLRVWKTFAPKGDAARMQQLLQLRADYLRLLAPASLSSVFKNSIESELLCELFATIHQTMDITGGDREFIVSFVTELPRVQRFSMVIMFLSDKEKEDIARVIEALLKSEEQGSDLAAKLQALKSQYGLK